MTIFNWLNTVAFGLVLTAMAVGTWFIFRKDKRR